jgi:DNA repair protein RadC
MAPGHSDNQEPGSAARHRAPDRPPARWPDRRDVRGWPLKRYPIRDWPEGERPRERLVAEGPRRLTTSELLAIILQTGGRGQSAVDLARTLLREWEGLAGLEAADPADLKTMPGLGPAKVAQVKAALELGRRLLAEVERVTRPRITSSRDVLELAAPRLRGLQHEQCEVVLLNGGNEVVALETLSEGSVTESPVYPRDILQRANRHHAAAIILIHNHPSGNSQPSGSDRALTEELVLAGDLLRIPLVDHIIIGRQDHYSFADHGLIAEYQRQRRAPRPTAT